MKRIPQNLRDKVRAAEPDEPLLELWRCQIDATEMATTCAAFTFQPEPVTHLGVIYYPWPVERADVTQDSEGNLPTMTLTMSNATRHAARWAQLGRGFRGRRIEWRVVHPALIDVDVGDLTAQFVGRQVVVNRDSLEIEMSFANLFDVKFPQNRYGDSRCPLVHRGPVCLDRSRLGPCPKTLVACEERGRDELAQNLPPLHPMLFGAFPGISNSRI